MSAIAQATVLMADEVPLPVAKARSCQASLAQLLRDLEALKPRLGAARDLIRRSSLSDIGPAPLDLADELCLRELATQLRTEASAVADAIDELSTTKPFDPVERTHFPKEPSSTISPEELERANTEAKLRSEARREQERGEARARDGAGGSLAGSSEHPSKVMDQVGQGKATTVGGVLVAGSSPRPPSTLPMPNRRPHAVDKPQSPSPGGSSAEEHKTTDARVLDRSVRVSDSGGGIKPAGARRFGRPRIP